MILNYFLAYGVYIIGALLFFLDKISEYKKIANANPNPDITFELKTFWSAEWVNVIKVILLGIATMILLIPLGGISVDFHNSAGQSMFTTSVKVILLPLYLVMGWTGGKGTIALAGQYKKELYKKVGIDSDS